MGAPVNEGSKIYIGSFKKHVNLEFEISCLAKVPINLHDRAYKTMRHIKIQTLDELTEKKVKIIHFLKLVDSYE